MNILKNFIINGICLSPLLWSHPPYATIEDLTETPIISPCFAKRETLKIRLSNGLKLILFQIPNLRKQEPY